MKIFRPFFLILILLASTVIYCSLSRAQSSEEKTINSPNILEKLSFKERDIIGAVPVEDLEEAENYTINIEGDNAPKSLFEPCRDIGNVCRDGEDVKACTSIELKRLRQCVYTCSDYKKALSDGWSSKKENNMAVKIEGIFIKNCGAIRLFKNSKLISPENEKGLIKTFLNPEKIPAELLSGIIPEINVCDAGDSIGQCMSIMKGALRIRISTKIISVKNGNHERVWTPIGVADFNKDGIDELLVWEFTTERFGTYKNYAFRCLSKGNSSNGVLKDVSCSNYAWEDYIFNQ